MHLYFQKIEYLANTNKIGLNVAIVVDLGFTNPDLREKLQHLINENEPISLAYHHYIALACFPSKFST